MILIYHPETNDSISRPVDDALKGSFEVLQIPVASTCAADFLAESIHGNKPDTIINCNEFSDIDAAEERREEAYRTNAFFAKDLSTLCNEGGIHFYHLSSSYVFDGIKGAPHREENEPDPVSVFGDSKLLGERFIKESGCRFCIIRASDLYGDGLPLVSPRFALVRDGSVCVLKDQVIAPTCTLDLARAVALLVSHKAGGVFHFNLRGSTSPRMFLEKAFELESARGREKGREVVELAGEEFLAPADRPLYNVLDPVKFRRTFGPVRDWESALEDYISAEE